MTNLPKIIGLTGNIATGKSVVGQMLANSGGLEIDADVVANRMLYPGAPAYQPVIEAFGDSILTKNGKISRKKLGKLVFSDPRQLEKLEQIVHPEVTKSIKTRIKEASRFFVVIEAIKLLESDLIEICDVLWVSHASVSNQMDRLLRTRNLSENDAKDRIQAQPPQSEKLNRADIVINTEGSFKQTWQQIQDGLANTMIGFDSQNKSMPFRSGDWYFPDVSAFPQEDAEILWQSHAEKAPSDWYATLGSRIVLPALKEDRLKGLLLWDNWNFSAAFDCWVANDQQRLSEKAILDAFNYQIEQQECEVILITIDKALKNSLFPAKIGFRKLRPDELPYPAWQEAASKINADEKIWIKFLKEPVEIIDK
ncbi:MAG: dephospho-CoA kinase [Brevefilum sp.]|nr:dephospho-CoA kinase [Brevefilum sp.]MDT8382166.1 dephospho-CoA kinase [Brevefilum sp.]MDW7754933.1 dephospho-CoA kinase [Brevefilum sp.]